MLVISVTSASPCAGASSLCAALASHAARSAGASRVLCADASDGPLGASRLFGRLEDDGGSRGNDKGDGGRGLLDSLCQSSCGVCVLRVPGDHLEGFCNITRSLPFDLVFIDSGFRLGEAQEVAGRSSDMTLCVTLAEGNCLARLDAAVPTERERFVINRFDSRSHSMYDCRLFLSSSALAPRLLRTTIPFDEAVLASTLSLKPYPLSSPFSAAADAASGVLAEILSDCREGKEGR